MQGGLNLQRKEKQSGSLHYDRLSLSFSLRKSSCGPRRDQIRRITTESPLGFRPDIGTQPCYQSTSDLWVENL